MKATEAKFLDFLKKSPQFVIPIYQRTYSWTDKECRQLWDDIIRTGKDDNISVHFVGSIVYIEKADSTVTTWEPLLVIDGQQRLTTVTLLIAALANSIGDEVPMDGFSAKMLQGYYLQNPLENGDRKYKLLLSQTDKSSLKAIVNQHDQPQEYSLRVVQNYELFKELISGCDNDLVAVCKGLAKLMMVDIKLKRGEDNPQLIFESMNSTGKKLSQADLIRNYILMGLEQELQTHLYETYWRPMEVSFGQEAYDSHFDAFMRHYLTVKTGEIPRLDEVYEAFKTHAVTPVTANNGVEDLVKDIRNYAKYFCAMALGVEHDVDLKVAFHDLRELKVDVAYPFLLELYHDYTNGQLSKDDFTLAVRWTEAFVFRRAICAIPTNSMNKTFATFSKALKKDRYLESIAAQFLSMPSYRRFPTDDEFERDMQTRDLYHFRSRSYWLRRFENFDRKEVVPVDSYTIEHILPQNENLNSSWKEALGVDWKAVQNTWLHTLGNLTLTGYNSEYSDKSFVAKRDMKGGFKDSPLKVNEGLAQLEIWNEAAIKLRAGRLAKQAVMVWSSPKLSQEIIDSYTQKPVQTSQYSIETHPYLLTQKVGALFEALRKEIIALDPCIIEEYLKRYVAYKAETNFVVVVPQSDRLRLRLNIPFNELNDPKAMCIDISKSEKPGSSARVRVFYDSLEQLQYIVGLVRQALEQQLGEPFE